MDTFWKVDGTYFESCNCDVACPCVFTSAPTEGDCTAVVAWHIDEGAFGDVTLDGLNVVLAAYSPGHMLESPWQVALYVDETADEAQQQALIQIFGGQAGGHPAALGQFVDEVLGVKPAAITYRKNGRQRHLQINGIAEVAIAGMGGQGDADVTLHNNPITVAPGYPAVAAKSETLTYRDYGFDWSLSGKNGFYSPFAYQGP